MYDLTPRFDEKALLVAGNVQRCGALGAEEQVLLIQLRRPPPFRNYVALCPVPLQQNAVLYALNLHHLHLHQTAAEGKQIRPTNADTTIYKREHTKQIEV